MNDDELELSQLQLLEMYRGLLRTADQYRDAELWSDDEARLYKLLQADVRRYLDKFDEVERATVGDEPDDPLYRERRRSRYDEGTPHDHLYRAAFAGGSKGDIERALERLRPYYRDMDERLKDAASARRQAELDEAIAEGMARFEAQFGPLEDKSAPQPHTKPTTPPAGGHDAGEAGAGDAAAAEGKPRPSLKLRGPDEPPLIRGEPWDYPLNPKQYCVLKMLADKFPHRVYLATLRSSKSGGGGVGGAAGILKRLREKPPWDSVIEMGVKDGGRGQGKGYKIKPWDDHDTPQH
jgi:hypothetical protein